MAPLETPGRIEPCLLEGADSGVPADLANLAGTILEDARKLDNELRSPGTRQELAELVRVMNAYYSGLIEGHDVRPRDIEYALAGAEVDDKIRPLAEEAKAHVLVEREIDELFAADRLPVATSIEFIRYVHARFYENMPAEYRVMTSGDGRKIEIVPGRFRETDDEDVSVGRHQPPSSVRVAEYMKHFARRYGELSSQNKIRYMLAIPAAHHRLNFIHPFPDGNGRVSRLVSHAMALHAGIGSHGLWSISRGLARGLVDSGEYKRQMDAADGPRRGDLDGRGNLSLAALSSFTEWFLKAAHDQIRFSLFMFDQDRLLERYTDIIRETVDDARAPTLAEAVFLSGELDRGHAALVLQTSQRTARKTLTRLVSAGFLKSDGPKTPVRIAFPLDYRERFFPDLFGAAERDPDSFG
ncbi:MULTISPECIES: Fic family protein [Parvibaculum]|uniref:Fic family protein n=1 Tax=Parvibaculum TaxID=256616 RepID=UPI000C921CE2|nr:MULTISPECIES: Fic family protein [Parvibaculum]MAB12698.1 filamentation induced by cAMP protein fic [Parvibaculum sp.]NIJ41559.1 Fic family protein [Parvibaculum indicum]